MSGLDRRVQLLLAPAQYDQLEHEAVRTGQSVAAVIRESIDARLAARHTVRSAAATRLLRSAESNQRPGDDWESVKADLEFSRAASAP